ncbi:nicotinate-nucleotide--dimethylbenzimidazole phosphoribosyltransferase [Chitinibacteraceae bacterium HSL-7]
MKDLSPIAQAARAHQSQLTKPPGSLGQLEELAVWLADRLGDVTPAPLKPAIAVFAADHGVAASGVSAFPAEVTGQMVANFAGGGAAISVLARAHGASLTVVDVGVAHPVPLPAAGEVDLVIRPVRAGTANLLNKAAMSASDAQAAWFAGEETADRLINTGANLLIGGEMGIANTTAAAALICALTGQKPADIVGRGTGVDDARLTHKVAVVEAALARAAGTDTAFNWLCEVGGLEIAALAGFFSRAAERHTPVLLDGFITTSAALVAVHRRADVADWLIASHRSDENGHGRALEALGLTPLLSLGLRLGEASGAALALPIVQAALTLHREMATFASAGVSAP